MKRVLLLMLLFALALPGVAAVYRYDASVTPDSPRWQDTFSCSRLSDHPDVHWCVEDGTLLMTTKPLQGIWFGNHASDPVSWKPAAPAAGNHLAVRAKLLRDSKEFTLVVRDGQYRGQIILMPDEIQYVVTTADGGATTVQYPVKATDYHSYAVTVLNGHVVYQVDNRIIYCGDALRDTIEPMILVGDISGNGGMNGQGTLAVKRVEIETYGD